MSADIFRQANEYAKRCVHPNSAEAATEYEHHAVQTLTDQLRNFWAFVSSNEAVDDACFAEAAMNSYRKHFGDRAVEAAEEDVLGMALETLSRCVASLGGLIADTDGRRSGRVYPNDRKHLAEARAVLALVGEGEKT